MTENLLNCALSFHVLCCVDEITSKIAGSFKRVDHNIICTHLISIFLKMMTHGICVF